MKTLLPATQLGCLTPTRLGDAVLQSQWPPVQRSAVEGIAGYGTSDPAAFPRTRHGAREFGYGQLGVRPGAAMAASHAQLNLVRGPSRDPS